MEDWSLSEEPIDRRLARRHIVAFWVVLAAAGIAAVLFFSPAERGDAVRSGSSDEVGPDAAPHRSVGSPFGDGLAQQGAADPPMPLWRFVDKPDSTAKPPYPAQWSRAGRALVDVSTAAEVASAWQVGDRFTMQLPQAGAPYEGSIQRIDEGPGHSRSARGMAITADGTPRRFVVTVGPTRVLAYIDTPVGPYELVADTRLGWLVPTSSMLAGFDYSKPDYIVPERRPVPQGPPR